MAEMVWRRLIARTDDLLARLGSIGIFSAAWLLSSLRQWPPLARLTLLAYMVAFIVIRLAIAVMALAVVSPRQGPRLSILTVVLTIAIATSAVVGPLGLDQDAADVISICFSLIVLFPAVEGVWSTMDVSAALKAAVLRMASYYGSRGRALNLRCVRRVALIGEIA